MYSFKFRSREPLNITFPEHREQRDVDLMNDLAERLTWAIDHQIDECSIQPQLVGDWLHDLLIGAMSGVGGERADLHDPFGVFDDVRRLPTWAICRLYNHFLTDQHLMVTGPLKFA